MVMKDDKTNDKADKQATPKKRSFLDNAGPMQRRVFEKMGIVIKVEKPDNMDDKK